jgi:hypothetical protein
MCPLLPLRRLAFVLSPVMPSPAWLKPGPIVLRKHTFVPCRTRRKRVVLWQ